MGQPLAPCPTLTLAANHGRIPPTHRERKPQYGTLDLGKNLGNAGRYGVPTYGRDVHGEGHGQGRGATP